MLLHREPGHSVFYVSKYPNEDDFKSKGFVSEIRSMMDGIPNKCDITAIKGVRFITKDAYGADDMKEYLFRTPSIVRVYEFEGNYVLRFRAGIVVNGYDMMNDYRERSLDEKYDNHEKRHSVVDMTGSEPERTYVCERCGKTVKYSTKEMDRVRYDDRDTRTTEYLDMQIAHETFGKYLCKDCMEEEINNIDLWKNRNTRS